MRQDVYSVKVEGKKSYKRRVEVEAHPPSSLDVEALHDTPVDEIGDGRPERDTVRTEGE